MKKIFLLLFFFSIHSLLFSQNSNKHAVAVRTATAPKIDGNINEELWKNASPIFDFTQYDPNYNKTATQKTEVRIAYDDVAIYIAAKMFDTSPDSILKQLGNRDDGTLNADKFGIEFDTYNKNLDAYIFEVSASGVQSDSRLIDPTYDAIWQSAVKINKDSWTAELKIPFSAIRFPKTEIQNWGLNIYRGIRRYRENDQWALEIKTASNNLVNWGNLSGIQNINLPIRLSFTPYFIANVESYPYNIEGKSNVSKSFSGGLDFKYGLNESFTIDMTLFPDFSQVQSDNQVKNLSAFETVYDDQRPFFKEAVDLFQKGDLFYSRRIGRTPLLYNDVYAELKDGEVVKNNPTKAHLLNATKLSGRNKNGLAIGVFNAITNDTYADIQDSLGYNRKYLTDPLTNYNIIVLDQTLKNNSSTYFINTSVVRDHKFNDANVTAAGINLNNKSNKYAVSLSGGMSQIISKNDTILNDFSSNVGHKYEIGFSKIKGNFQYSFSHGMLDNQWNANDIGLTLTNNEAINSAKLSYSIYEPFWKIKTHRSTFKFWQAQNYTSYKMTDLSIEFGGQETTLNYFTFWYGFYFNLQKLYDYYEPRDLNRFYLSPRKNMIYLGSSSDYRKTIAVDIQTQCYWNVANHAATYLLSLSPRIRIGNKLMLIPSSDFTNSMNDRGWVSTNDSTSAIYFGERNITTITNAISSQYIFKNDLSLGIQARHYWSEGIYDQYFLLNNDGNLSTDSSYAGSHDFNFSSFSIDLIFSWQFAPGSSLSFIWKNSILNENTNTSLNFNENFSHTLDSPQTNNFSLKVLYYFDYLYLKKFKNQKKTKL